VTAGAAFDKNLIHYKQQIQILRQTRDVPLPRLLAVTFRQRGVVVHINFRDFYVIRVFFRDLVEHGRQHFARTAPFGPEIHEDRLVGFQHLGFKVRLVDFNGRFHFQLMVDGSELKG
jgi:hypothetical protein